MRSSACRDENAEYITSIPRGDCIRPAGMPASQSSDMGVFAISTEMSLIGTDVSKQKKKKQTMERVSCDYLEA